MEKQMKRLGSNGFVCAPGIFRAMQNDYRAGQDDLETRVTVIRIMSDGWNLTYSEAKAILSGSTPVEIDDEAGTVSYHYKH